MRCKQRLAEAFNLNEDNWLKHANPWSVWTRYVAVPILLLSLWSRVWIGWWCLIPTIISIVWLYLNPIAFDKVSSTKNWASQAVLGERVSIEVSKDAFPEHHQNFPLWLLNVISGAGLLLSVWGTLYYDLTSLITGLLFIYLGKTWYLDRMVWLFVDMAKINDEVRKWHY